MKRLNFNLVSDLPEDNSIGDVCRCLGSRIADQMYHGIDSSNSTLVHGEYDDDDNWDVDPACDMSTDRFTLQPKSPIPVAETPPAE